MLSHAEYERPVTGGTKSSGVGGVCGAGGARAGLGRVSESAGQQVAGLACAGAHVRELAGWRGERAREHEKGPNAEATGTVFRFANLHSSREFGTVGCVRFFASATDCRAWVRRPTLQPAATPTSTARSLGAPAGKPALQSALWEAGATKRSLGSRRYKALYCQRRMMSVALMPPKPKELERPMSNLCAMALFGT